MTGKPGLLNRLLDFIITTVFIFMLLCAIFQVLFRYVLHFSVPWTEEAARFALIFVTFWGAATALRQKDHIAIATLFKLIPTRPRMALQFLFIIAMGTFLLHVLIGSISMAQLTWNTPVGSISWLTTGRVYLILTSGTMLILIYLVLWMVATILEFIHPGSQSRG